jgi:phosphoadenosine phosphosulfate reductase
MLERYHPRLALACSFQKEEAVLLHMLLKLEPRARVFTIDTGVLFPETYETWQKLEAHYNVRVEVFDASSKQPWSASNCCGTNKINALNAALSGLDGWITGLRREHAPTREHAPKVEFDHARGLYKANPLANYSEAEVWNYISEHNLPYNPLHDQGYASIGCAPCTLPGSGREGRWSGSDKTECGIHVR